MNRRDRRRFERERKAGRGEALLAAQALSREELDRAIGNWGGLVGATNFGPWSRTVRVRNRLGEPIVVMAELHVLPDPQEGADL